MIGTEKSGKSLFNKRTAGREAGDVLQLVEVMVEPDDDEPLSEEDRRAVIASREYFGKNHDGDLTMEQVAAECGFTLA